MSDIFIGSYEQLRAENMDAFYQEIGVDCETLRKRMCDTGITMYISREEDDPEEWYFEMIAHYKTIECFFKIDQKYEEFMLSGMWIESISTMDGDNKLVTKSKSMEEDHDASFERICEFSSSGIVMTFTAGTVVGKRHFMRLSSIKDDQFVPKRRRFTFL